MPLRTLLAALWVFALVCDRTHAVIVYTQPDELPQPQPQRQIDAKENEASARHMFEGLRAGGTERADELYALARKYPQTRTAIDALLLAGDKAIERGDLPAALVFYESAVAGGGQMNETRAKRFETVKKHSARKQIELPADLEGAISAKGFVGALPFDAAWLGDPGRAGYAKFFPYSCGDRVILAAWKGVSVLDAQGRAIWTTPNPKGPSGFSIERPNSGMRGAIFAPAVLEDIHGRPVIVVARQPGASGDTQYVLRAFRANDGRLLWSTETSEQRKDLTYAGLPAVCGRYVYSIAAGKAERSVGHLYMSAVDVSDGSVIWHTPIGSITETNMRGARKAEIGDPIELESLGYLSEPAVAGDLVIACTNCGAVVAVDRFTGKLRWVHVYRTVQGVEVVPDPRGRDRVRWQEWEAAQIARSPLARYRGTPVIIGKMVVVLPQDDGVALGLDRESGEKLWESTGLETMTAVAACGDRVILAGAAVGAIDPATAKLKWRFAPPMGQEITGPASVMGETVVVPVTSGVTQLSGHDGKERAAYEVPMLRRMLAGESGKAILNELGANKGFGSR